MIIEINIDPISFGQTWRVWASSGYDPMTLCSLYKYPAGDEFEGKYVVIIQDTVDSTIWYAAGRPTDVKEAFLDVGITLNFWLNREQ